ncbi:hypothetical protein M0P98_01555 [bacterium]|nr:hypothetical protein [bacterium]
MKRIFSIFHLILVNIFFLGINSAIVAEEQWIFDLKTGCKIAWVSDVYTPVSVNWNGPVVNGKAEGQGALMLVVRGKDGKEKQCEANASMKEGKLDGNVKIKWSNGEYYEGTYKGGLKEGHGFHKGANGIDYYGDWHKGQPSGWGVMKWPSGIIYKGELNNGIREGQGVMIWGDGAVSKGMWKDDEFIEAKKQYTDSSYLKLTYTPGVTKAIRENTQRVVNILTELFIKYKLTLDEPITVIVTANTQSFIKSIASISKVSEDVVAKDIGSSLGVSLSNQKTIIIRGGNYNHVTGIRDLHDVFAHESFHQILDKFSRIKPAYFWIEEGSAEYFRLVALEEAKLDSIGTQISLVERNVRNAPSLPNTHQLSNYMDFQNLRLNSNIPIYNMSLLMVYNLIEKRNFGKVISFYRLIDTGMPQDKAFYLAFGKQASSFMDEMNIYFKTLKGSRPSSFGHPRK